MNDKCFILVKSSKFKNGTQPFKIKDELMFQAIISPGNTKSSRKLILLKISSKHK